MRIVAGSLKGRRLDGPAPGATDLRPTSDRAREALFSILQDRPRGPFLDLFAGTGAVGLEAWSRGHAPVVCVEQAPAALRLLRGNCAGTGVQVLAADARKLGAGAFSGLGLVFADPPYALAGPMLAALAPRLPGWLAPDGLVVWEQGAREPFAAPAGLRLLDTRTYGAASFHFLGPCP